jgi:ribonuclease P protein component
LRISFVAKPAGDQGVDVAFAISRKVGNAVVRNTIRRRLRALMDALEPEPRPGLYLIRCSIDTGSLNYDELHHHLHTAVARARAN